MVSVSGSPPINEWSAPSMTWTDASGISPASSRAFATGKLSSSPWRMSTGTSRSASSAAVRRGFGLRWEVQFGEYVPAFEEQ